MPYLDRMLGEDEQVLFVTRHHWLDLTLRSIPLALVFLIGLAIATAGNLLGGPYLVQFGLGQTEQLAVRVVVVVLLVAYPAIALTIRLLHWWSNQLVVTNFRIIHLSGILAKSSLDSSLEKVNDVLMTQTILGRMFDYGTLEILTASEFGVNKLSRIARPLQFKRAMLDAKQAIEGSPHTAAAPSIPQLIAELATLRDQGTLTEAEFQAQKSALLRRI